MNEWPNWTEADYKRAAEEDRRLLAEYFAAHPDIPGFTLGDVVQITNEARSRLITYLRVRNVGQTAIVGAYDPTRHAGVYLQSVESQWLSVFPLTMVGRMRQVYLDQRGGNS